MKIGAMIFATDQTIKIPRLAVELEARGYESLWVPEKTHLPTSRRTPWPGGELPEWYKRTSDPLTSLAAAAAVTTTLRLGTGVLLVPLYDPVILAKAIATLDFLADGRFEFGVGYGWNHEEYATHGVTLGDSPDIMRDKIALMQ
ncbi:MAG: LLM class flavin-dependent oxidoreductase [Halioglobus sp.]|nr:LLM class flavin-dependent oxidoreductase [Halioglobus sp.]